MLRKQKNEKLSDLYKNPLLELYFLNQKSTFKDINLNDDINKKLKNEKLKNQNLKDFYIININFKSNLDLQQNNHNSVLPERKLAPEAKHDLKKIQAFLDDIELVKSELDTVEQHLRLFAGREFDEKNNTLIDYVPGQPWKHRKLLSRYIKVLGEQFGFTGIEKMTKGYSEERFFQVLKDKRLIKDKAFRDEIHGEYTHTLQWICVILFMMTNSSKFKTTPAELYAAMGKAGGLHWLKTFELDVTRPAATQGYGHVGNFNRFLLSDVAMERYPVLCQLIRGRMAKTYLPQLPISNPNKIKRHTKP